MAGAEEGLRDSPYGVQIHREDGCSDHYATMHRWQLTWQLSRTQQPNANESAMQSVVPLVLDEFDRCLVGLKDRTLTSERPFRSLD